MLSSNGFAFYLGGGAPAGAAMESQGNNLVRNNTFVAAGTVTAVGSM
jgi:hypothetical protein